MSWRRPIDVQDGKRIVDWPRLIIVVIGTLIVLSILDAVVPDPWFWIGLAVSAPFLIALHVYLVRRS